MLRAITTGIYDASVDTVAGLACPALRAPARAPPPTSPAGGCPCTRTPGRGNSYLCRMGIGQTVYAYMGPEGGAISLLSQQGTPSNDARDLRPRRERHLRVQAARRQLHQRRLRPSVTHRVQPSARRRSVHDRSVDVHRDRCLGAKRRTGDRRDDGGTPPETGAVRRSKTRPRAVPAGPVCSARGTNTPSSSTRAGKRAASRQNVEGATLEARRRRLVALPWTWDA
jgi:hypothetical protein